MKTIISVLLITFISGFKQLYQEITIAEPEFTGIILIVRGNSSGEQLEKQKAASASKADIGAALFGVSKARGMNIVNGIESPVRASSGNPMKFIVRVKENDRDPVEVINIFRLEQDVKKERRAIVTGTVNFNQSTASDIEFIPFQAAKYGQSSYLVEIADLPAGEYAMTLEGSRDVFNLFGVD